MAIFQSLGIIWKNRRHFQLQIFGLMTFFVVAVFVINLITIKVGYENNRQAYADTVSKRTTNFVMSRSGTSGTVNNVFVNYDKTRCFIVLTLANTTNVTLDANYYAMYITNCNINGKVSGTPKEVLSGVTYIFAKNIMGLYIRSDKPFENNLKKLTLRSYYNADDGRYDDAEIYFNPGATNIVNIPFLEYHTDGEPFNLTDIMRQTSSVNEESVIRSNIEQCYAIMQDDMRKAAEYASRLQDTYNVQIPVFPAYLAGDSFNDIPVYDEMGNQTGSYTKFIPATIVPGGTEYDWYNGNILIGYYNLVPNASRVSIRDYLDALYADKESHEKPKAQSKEWYYEDGTEVVLNNRETSSGLEVDVLNTINTYEEILQDYLNQKTKYQTEYLPELLKLEMNSDYSAYSYSVRNDENAVITY